MLKRISKRVPVPNLITGGIALYFIFRPLFVLYVLGIYDIIDMLISVAKSNN